MAQGDEQSLNHLACHEAGHAVLAWWLGYDLSTASIQMNRDRGAFHSTHVFSCKEDELMRVLGGPVAEELSKKHHPDLHLIVVPYDHPDHDPLLGLARSLSGRRPYTKLQLEYQKKVASVLRPAWSAVEAIAARLTAILDGNEAVTVSGRELEFLMQEHGVPRRDLGD